MFRGRHTSRRTKVVAAIAAAGLLLTGCSSDPTPPGPTTTDAPPTTETSITEALPPTTSTATGPGDLSQEVPQVGFAPSLTSGQTPEATVKELMLFVIQDADEMWSSYFAAAELQEPSVSYAFIEQPFYDACSKTYVQASTQNAYYCGDNDTIELPVTTMAQVMQGQVFQDLNDPTITNFGVALVVAHEFGHSIHQELELAQVPMTKHLNDVGDSYKELFADCAAGVWAYRAYYNGNLEAGDIESGVEVMASMGDAPGDDPRTPHGTAEQRVEAFNYGYNNGNPYLCMQWYLGVA